MEFLTTWAVPLWGYLSATSISNEQKCLTKQKISKQGIFHTEPLLDISVFFWSINKLYGLKRDLQSSKISQKGE